MSLYFFKTSCSNKSLLVGFRKLCESENLVLIGTPPSTSAGPSAIAQNTALAWRVVIATLQETALKIHNLQQKQIKNYDDSLKGSNHLFVTSAAWNFGSDGTKIVPLFDAIKTS